MTEPIIARRLVYHIGGYDFTMPVDAVHRRFVREMHRFERTWSTKAVASPPVIGPDTAAWDVITTGPNWRVETRYRFVRWDDLIEAAGERPLWQRVPLGLLAFLDYVAGGALWGYVRTNWRYALFFLYPYVLFAGFAAIGWFSGAFVAKATGFTLFGIVAGIVVFLGLLHWLGRWLLLPQLFDDWIFARTYIRQGDPALDQRLDRIAHDLIAAARAGEADEILLLGHSLGAVLAIDLIDRALRLDPAFGRDGPSVALISVGSSILKIGLHRGAKRFHAAVERVASAPGIFWAEYQALTDVMNFYKTDPVAEMGLTATTHPVVRIVRIKRMLDPAAYRRIRRSLFRVHCQFVSGNDLRAPYDYFMLLCGPLSARRQVALPEGAASAIGADGELLAPTPQGTAAFDQLARTGGR
ncbi:MAG: hypothetical protein WAL40_11350 [Rhodoplanes sp.]